MFFAFLCPGESPWFDLLLPAREGDRDLTGQVPLAAGGAGEPGMQGAETIRLHRWLLRGCGAGLGLATDPLLAEVNIAHSGRR